MPVDLEEGVDRLNQDDAHDREGEVNECLDDLIVQDVLVLRLDLVQQPTERPQDEDDQGKSESHDCQKEVVDISGSHLHFLYDLIITKEVINA
jgi:hypothetical protein